MRTYHFPVLIVKVKSSIVATSVQVKTLSLTSHPLVSFKVTPKAVKKSAGRVEFYATVENETNPNPTKLKGFLSTVNTDFDLLASHNEASLVSTKVASYPPRTNKLAFSPASTVNPHSFPLRILLVVAAVKRLGKISN
jgi:hypothetical protein